MQIPPFAATAGQPARGEDDVPARPSRVAPGEDPGRVPQPVGVLEEQVSPAARRLGHERLDGAVLRLQCRERGAAVVGRPLRAVGHVDLHGAGHQSLGIGLDGLRQHRAAGQGEAAGERGDQEAAAREAAVGRGDALAAEVQGLESVFIQVHLRSLAVGVREHMPVAVAR